MWKATIFFRYFMFSKLCINSFRSSGTTINVRSKKPQNQWKCRVQWASYNVRSLPCGLPNHLFELAVRKVRNQSYRWQNVLSWSRIIHWFILGITVEIYVTPITRFVLYASSPPHTHTHTTTHSVASPESGWWAADEWSRDNRMQSYRRTTATKPLSHRSAEITNLVVPFCSNSGQYVVCSRKPGKYMRSTKDHLVVMIIIIV